MLLYKLKHMSGRFHPDIASEVISKLNYYDALKYSAATRLIPDTFDDNSDTYASLSFSNKHPELNIKPFNTHADKLVKGMRKRKPLKVPVLLQFYKILKDLRTKDSTAFKRHKNMIVKVLVDILRTGNYEVFKDALAEVTETERIVAPQYTSMDYTLLEKLIDTYVNEIVSKGTNMFDRNNIKRILNLLSDEDMKGMIGAMVNVYTAYGRREKIRLAEARKIIAEHLYETGRINISTKRMIEGSHNFYI